MAGNSSGSDNLTAKQQRAVRVLLTSKSVGEAAQLAGVGERTLFRWLTEPPFKAALSVAEGELLDVATRRLLGLQDKAIETFENVLKDEEATQVVRLRAAQAVLDYLLKLRELRNVEQRLTALEQAYAEQQQGERNTRYAAAAKPLDDE